LHKILGKLLSIVGGVCGFMALAFAAPACLAQQYSFTAVTQGLGNLNVNCIAQDRSGYLWVGTENGLYRYDGRQFQQFGIPEGLFGHVIQSLFSAPDGTLFVGTTTGIYFRRQDGRFIQIHAPAPVSGFSQRIGTVFTALAPDQVVTTDRGGVFLLRRSSVDNWNAELMHLDGAAIWSVLAAPGGVLWYGCDTDLCRFQNGKTTHLREALNLPEERWVDLLLARDGQLWIHGSTHAGEVSSAADRFESHDLPGRSNAVSYSALVAEPDGQVVAAQGNDFGLWEGTHWRMVTAMNGLTHYDISELFVDREGSLWIGVVGHGLMQWVGQNRWEAYTAANGLSDDIVWATLRDREGRLWIGTESGLDLLLPGSETPKPWQAPGIQSARAYSLVESEDGSIWMGSGTGNLVRIDPDTLSATQWKVPEVFSILSDGDRIWIATDDGLYIVDTKSSDRSPRFVEDPGIAHPHQRFTDLALDRGPATGPDQGTLLWAAADAGLFRMDESGWHAVDPGLSGVGPIAIAPDASGNIWVSGAFPGVMRLRVVHNRVVESEHIVRPHMLSDQAVCLLVDHRGWLWVGQDAGLSVFDGHSWRSFTQDDGLIWNDTDSYGLAEDRDGSLWIATSGGLSHLKQAGAAPTVPPPAPVFSRIMFGTDSIGSDSEVPWSASPLSITMAVLSYRNIGHMRIRYRLLGVESEWVETAERSVRYPRLEPGAYTLQAISVDGVSGASSPQAEISFVIVPRWWQSEPLRLAFVLVAALCVVLAWRWSVHLLMRQKRHLEHAVEIRTQDLEREKAELLRAREQMRHYAEHDDLTGLWNHRIIVDRLRQEVDRSQREGSPLSLILVDLDHFKNVNDTFGHPSGDLVLKEISAVLQSSVRSYDWVGRYGGEEFLLILPGSNFAGARVRAENMRIAVQAAHIHDGERVIPITASFGVAAGFPSQYEILIQTADEALYRAKDNGRNCVIATEIEPPASASEPQG
jgi:diguanylate cyclase (GGDEF)-like protein